jgi:hypothetical protein
MTTKDYIAKLNKAEREINGKRFVGLSSQIGRKQFKRVFAEGLDAGGGPIKPEYSTKPISIGRNQTPVASTAGTYKGGYKEFKSALGRGKMVLFRLFSQMYLQSIVNPDLKISDTGFVIATGMTYNAGNPKGKVDALLDKYGDAFKFSDAERKEFTERAEQIVVDLFK